MWLLSFSFSFPVFPCLYPLDLDLRICVFQEADILERIIKFFHCDIKTILRNANYDRALVTTKLMAMMDHYIPVSQQHGDLFSLTFGILPILYLPKVSYSNYHLGVAGILLPLIEHFLRMIGF